MWIYLIWLGLCSSQRPIAVTGVVPIFAVGQGFPTANRWKSWKKKYRGGTVGRLGVDEGRVGSFQDPPSLLLTFLVPPLPPFSLTRQSSLISLNHRLLLCAFFFFCDLKIRLQLEFLDSRICCNLLVICCILLLIFVALWLCNKGGSNYPLLLPNWHWLLPIVGPGAVSEFGELPKPVAVPVGNGIAPNSTATQS